MLAPRDAALRRCIWFAAVGAVVGGPLGYLIARLAGGGEFGWPVLLAVLVANAGALLTGSGRLISVMTGTLTGISYVTCAILGYVFVLGRATRFLSISIAYNDAAFWGITLAAGTIGALGLAWWFTREQQQMH